MYLAVIFFPLFNYLVCSFGSRLLGRFCVYILSIFFLGTSFLFSCIILFSVIYYSTITELVLFEWCLHPSFSFSCFFLYDSLSCVMLFVVTSVSFLVHLYSGFYMDHDPYLPRFLSYLSLFTFFMLFYVTSGNFIQLFLGWEGIGLCSYLLINFWYTRVEANKAALKAVIVNKIGDFGFLFGILLCAILFKSVDFNTIYANILVGTPEQYEVTFVFFNTPITIAYLNIISFFFIIGVVGKSAQIGLHTWLPDAMEGPTPVSALIHAATMVTAGVFLVIRASFIFSNALPLLELLVFLGTCTAFFSGTVALFQYDMKKIIAYSTCSQLGYMILACGLGGFDLALFHLFNHAFFKALLFLSSGVIIHAFSDEQDIRRYGRVLKALPFVLYSMLIGSLSLMGIPYLSGFYSKDKILELAYFSDSNFAFFGYFWGVLGACLTAAYSSRLLYLVFYASLDKTPFYFASKTFYLESFQAKVLFLPQNSFLLILKYFFRLHTGVYFSLLQNLFVSISKIFLKFYFRLLGSDFFFEDIFFIRWFSKFVRLQLSFLNKFSFFFFFVDLFKAPGFVFLNPFLVVFLFFRLLCHCLNFVYTCILACVFYLFFFCKGLSERLTYLFLSLFNIFFFEYIILIPLIVLLFGSIFSGYFFFDLFLGAGSSFFSGVTASSFDLISIELLNQNPTNGSLVGLPIILKLLPLILSLFGFFFVPFFYTILGNFFFSRFTFFPKLVPFMVFFNKKWFFDNFYNFFLHKNFNWIFTLYIAVDKSFLEFLNVGFISHITTYMVRVIKYLHSGLLSGYIYVLIICFLVCALLFYVF